MIKILFICHGNICRSTLAQSVFTHKVASQGLSAHFLIDSAATSTEEIGNHNQGAPNIPPIAPNKALIIAIRATNARSIAPTFKANPKPSEAPFAAASITFSLSTLTEKIYLL